MLEWEGIRIGFDKAGFKTVYANDVEPSCKLTYDANFNNINLDLKDLRKVSTSNLPNLLDFSAIKSVWNQ